MSDSSRQPPPVVLLIDDNEWRARSLESIFKPGGFAVVKAYTGKQALEIAPRILPDVIVTAHLLPDTTAPVLLGAMRSSEYGSKRNRPVLVLAPERLSRSECVAVLRAGAWDVITLPLDPELLLLRIGTYVAAKQEGDAAAEASLVDAAVGCYNISGLLKRSEELAADASRHNRDLACIVLGASPSNGDPPSPATRLREVASVLGGIIRVSDALACLAEGEFAIVAPGTDSAGATRLAQRILDAIDLETPGAPDARPGTLRAGVSAVRFEGNNEISPMALLGQARTALRVVQRSGNVDRVGEYSSN